MKSRRANRSVIDILIRDGTWAFAVVLRELSPSLCATHVWKTVRTVVLVLSMVSTLLPPSLNRAAAFYR